MYAIIEACGKQYKVAQGDVVFFEKLDAEEGKKVNFDNVILVSNDNGKIEIGNPYVKGAKVEGKVVSHGKAKKILVYKYKAKKNYRRTQGHRQPYTKVEITSVKISAEKKAEEAKVEAKAEEKVEAKAKTEAKTTKTTAKATTKTTAKAATKTTAKTTTKSTTAKSKAKTEVKVEA